MVDADFYQRESYCVDEDGGLTANDYLGDGIPFEECLARCARKLWNGNEGCHGVEYRPAQGEHRYIEDAEDATCPNDFPMCHINGDCIIDSMRDCHGADCHWELGVTYMIGTGNGEC